MVAGVLKRSHVVDRIRRDTPYVQSKDPHMP